jgi:hypothetical protein
LWVLDDGDIVPAAHSVAHSSFRTGNDDYSPERACGENVEGRSQDRRSAERKQQLRSAHAFGCSSGKNDTGDR